MHMVRIVSVSTQVALDFQLLTEFGAINLLCCASQSSGLQTGYSSG